MVTVLILLWISICQEKIVFKAFLAELVGTRENEGFFQQLRDYLLQDMDRLYEPNMTSKEVKKPLFQIFNDDFSKPKDYTNCGGLIYLFFSISRTRMKIVLDSNGKFVRLALKELGFRVLNLGLKIPLAKDGNIRTLSISCESF